MAVQLFPARTTQALKFGVNQDRRKLVFEQLPAAVGLTVLGENLFSDAKAAQQPNIQQTVAAPVDSSESTPGVAGFLNDEFKVSAERIQSGIQALFPKAQPEDERTLKAEEAERQSKHQAFLHKTQRVSLKKNQNNGEVNFFDLLKTYGIDPYNTFFFINGKNLAQAFFAPLGIDENFKIKIDPTETLEQRKIRVARDLGALTNDPLNEKLSIDTDKKYRALVANLVSAYVLNRLSQGQAPVMNKDALPITFKQQQSQFISTLFQVDAQDTVDQSSTYPQYIKSVDGSVYARLALDPKANGNARLIDTRAQLISIFELLFNEALNKTRPDGGNGGIISPINGVTQDFKRLLYNQYFRDRGIVFNVNLNQPPSKVVFTVNEDKGNNGNSPLDTLTGSVINAATLIGPDGSNSDNVNAFLNFYFPAKAVENTLEAAPAEAVPVSGQPSDVPLKIALLRAKEAYNQQGIFSNGRPAGKDEAGNKEQALFRNITSDSDASFKPPVQRLLNQDLDTIESTLPIFFTQTFAKSRPGTGFSVDRTTVASQQAVGLDAIQSGTDFVPPTKPPIRFQVSV